MTTYYIDPTSTTNGVGSEADPYNAIPTLGSNNSYLFKRGTKLTFLNTEYVLDCSNLTGVVFGAYGVGPRPILSGEARGTWVYDTTYSVWYSESFDTTRGPGVVTEDGVALQWIRWDTDISTTSGSMPKGSFSLDHTSSPKRVYCKPNSNTPLNLLVASSWCAVYKARSPTGSLTITDLQLDYFSGNCINIGGATNTIIENNLIRFAGGFRNTTANFTGGAGIQVFDDSNNVVIRRNTILDSFDSGITPQSFVDNRTISNVFIYENDIRRFALGGVEVATFSPGTVLANINVFANYIEGGGRGYSGLGDEAPGGENEVVPAGLYADFAATTTSVGCNFYNNTVVDCYYGGSIRGSNNSTYVNWSSNIIQNCDYGFRVRNRSFGASYGMNVEIVGNLLNNIINTAFVMSVQFGTTNATNIYNNTVVSLGGKALSQTYSVSSWNYSNNIVLGNSSEGLVISGGTAPACSYNYTIGFTDAYVGMSDPVTDELINTPQIDTFFYPLSDSSLIAAGVFLGVYKNANGRTFQVPPSIGAFEYVRPKTITTTRTMRS